MTMLPESTVTHTSSAEFVDTQGRALQKMNQSALSKAVMLLLLLLVVGACALNCTVVGPLTAQCGSDVYSNANIQGSGTPYVHIQ